MKLPIKLLRGTEEKIKKFNAEEGVMFFSQDTEKIFINNDQDKKIDIHQRTIEDVGDSKINKLPDGWADGNPNTIRLGHSNTLYSFNENQYIAYLRFDGHISFVKKNLTTNDQERYDDAFDISIPENGSYRSGHDTIYDNHNHVAIGIDPDGYIHCMYNMHGSDLNYRKSSNPEDITSWSDKLGLTDTREDEVSYPTFFNDPETDKLYLLLRYGSSGNGDVDFYEYDESTEDWSRTLLIDGRNNDVNAYWWGQPRFDKEGNLHLFWNWRETGYNDTNYDICYAKWDGDNWYKSDGAQYDLPITTSNAETVKSIAQGEGLLEMYACDADDKGNPHAVYHQNNERDLMCLRHIYFDGNDWKDQELIYGDRGKPTSYNGDVNYPWSRLEIAINQEDGTVYILYRYVDEGNGLSVIYSNKDNYDKWYRNKIFGGNLYGYDPMYDRERWLDKNILSIYIQPASTAHNRIQADDEGGGYSWLCPKRTPVYVLDFNPQKSIPQISFNGGYTPGSKANIIYNLSIPNYELDGTGSTNNSSEEIEDTHFSLHQNMMQGIGLFWIRFFGRLDNDTSGERTNLYLTELWTLDGSEIDEDKLIVKGIEGGSKEIIDSGWVELDISQFRDYKALQSVIKAEATGESIGKVQYGTILIATS